MARMREVFAVRLDEIGMPPIDAAVDDSDHHPSAFSRRGTVVQHIRVDLRNTIVQLGIEVPRPFHLDHVVYIRQVFQLIRGHCAGNNLERVRRVLKKSVLREAGCLQVREVAGGGNNDVHQLCLGLGDRVRTTQRRHVPAQLGIQLADHGSQNFRGQNVQKRLSPKLYTNP